MSGKIDQVTLAANTFLEAMAEVTIAYLLLDAAVVAEDQRERSRKSSKRKPRRTSTSTRAR